MHPWQFVEEAASKEVEKDFKSVYSRLVLCKTFRLNEDGKVLSPEELLFRCVEAVNFTHNPQHAQMDVKLRSLICLGLNEQVHTQCGDFGIFFITQILRELNMGILEVQNLPF